LLICFNRATSSSMRLPNSSNRSMAASCLRAGTFGAIPVL
jgi:hypothetical protein